jgi:hypothetical protein
MSSAAVRQPARSPALPTAIVAVTFVAAAVGVLAPPRVFLIVAPAALLALVLMFTHERALSWRALMTTLVLVILFIPIGRYQLPGSLPFQLEPYRVFVALIFVAWGTALLVDRRVRLRSTGFDRPLLAIALTMLASVVVNPLHVESTASHVVKSLTFFGSFFIVLLVLVSVIRRYDDIVTLVRRLVFGMTIVAVTAIWEFRTGANLYNHLDHYVPFLRLGWIPDEPNRGGQIRAYASSQHPIAAGAVFVLLIPCAVALAHMTGKKRWWLSAVILLMGSFATGSRTGIVMFLVVAIVLVWLRPTEMRRLWPLILPGLAALHFAVPGMLGTIKDEFFPKGGLVAQQSQVVAGTTAEQRLRTHGRLTVWGPALNEVGNDPFLGEGFGTRVVDVGPDQNAAILDCQWLDTLLETGWVGGIAWFWLFGSTFRRMKWIARNNDGALGWLAAGLAAAILSYAVGLVFYDGFSFIQAVFVFFILLGITCCVDRWASTEFFTARSRATAAARLEAG